MSDLNSIMFYKAKFTIKSLDDNDDLLWRVVTHIRDWLKVKAQRNKYTLDTTKRTWSKLKTGGHIIPKDENKTAYIKTEYFNPSDSEEYWACKIVENNPPKPDVCRRQWITEIGFERSSKREAIFSCVLSYNDIPGFIGPCEKQPDPSLPGFIPQLLADEYIECYYGVDRVTSRAQYLKAGDFPEFLDKLECDGREMPYIYISPMKEDWDSPKTHLLIEPHELLTRQINIELREQK